MPLKPHPTDPDKMVYVSHRYDIPKLREEDDDIQDYVRPWVGLTDEELHEICNSYYYGDKELLKLLEAKLKEKNT
jgi:hypothetical protein